MYVFLFPVPWALDRLNQPLSTHYLDTGCYRIIFLLWLLSLAIDPYPPKKLDTSRKW